MPPLTRRTRQTLPQAEVRLLGGGGVRRCTRRFCRLPFRAGVFFLSTDFLRPLRTSWLMVGKIFSFCICLRRYARPRRIARQVSKCVQLIRTRKPCPFRSAVGTLSPGIGAVKRHAPGRVYPYFTVFWQVMQRFNDLRCTFCTISRKVVAKVANQWASRFCQSEQASPKPCNGRKSTFHGRRQQLPGPFPVGETARGTADPLFASLEHEPLD